MKNNKRGFTLIEIVMVLVLLGILAAVAIPKYYDLKTKAEEQTAKAVAAEFQARLNGSFADEILSGKACATAVTNALAEAKKLGSETNHGFKLVETGLNNVTDGIGKISLTKDDTTFGPFEVAVPVCVKPGTSSGQ